MPVPFPAASALLERLRAERPLISVELRPPRTGLSFTESMDVWIDMNRAVRRIGRGDTVVFVTDNAVGVSEEENLNHLNANLAGEVDPAKIVPFLTCKHSIEYCLMYAARAASHDFQALAVLGGDKFAGPQRCVENAYILRNMIRERVPGLALGGWANPHRDAAEQVGYLMQPHFAAEFYLTQVVSHHDLRAVEQFAKEARRREVPHPAVFGVFFYRSANPATLERLGHYFPVPARGIAQDFASGASPEEICARTIRELRDVGVDKVYVSNLGFTGAYERYRSIMDALEG
jgi:5,10-methylenetetrahydrofolate reductase